MTRLWRVYQMSDLYPNMTLRYRLEQPRPHDDWTILIQTPRLLVTARLNDIQIVIHEDLIHASPGHHPTS